MQFLPQDGIYVYFRYDNNKTVMVVMNQNKDEKKVDTKRFEERMAGFTKAKNIITDENITELKTLKISGMSIAVFELAQ
jgi:DNA-binding protein H-NS